RAALGREDGEAFCRRYGITPEGNFEGASLPNLIGRPLAEDERMSALRAKLYDFRRERMPLGRDDKVLTSWNALMIVALCASARALDRPDHLEAARRAERFLSERLSGPTGGPLLRWRDGEAKGEGVLADYAYLTLALTALHAATEEPAYLDKARRLAELTLERFGGEEGLYLYSSQSEHLITRPRETWDNPMPSGNACAGLALLRLAAREDGGRWQSAADRQLRFLAGAAQASPIGHGFSLLTLEEALQTNG
ncbi:MAG: hypothetical protein PHY12_11680, partial [Eubacteriales bacterium]|nr:hypothetical protein [Eubacteriales bacterium]